MKKIQEDFNQKNPDKVKDGKIPRLEPDIKAEDLIRGEMVGLGARGIPRNCFIYQDKLVSVTHYRLFLRDCNNLLSGESASILITEKYGGKGIIVDACTEVRHTKPEWGN